MFAFDHCSWKYLFANARSYSKIMLKNVWYRMWAVVDDMIKSTSVHHWGGLFCCCYRSAWNIFWAPLKSWIIKVMQLQNMFGRSCLISCFSWCCFKACVYSSLHLQQKKCWSYHLMFLSTSTFYKKNIKKNFVQVASFYLYVA